MKNTLLILSLFAALVVTSFWFIGSAKPELTAEARTQLTSEGVAENFAELSEGVVHYRQRGPETGPVIVLVHGLSNPSYVWKSHLESLAQAGYRVLAFDNYGRGFSDRPDGEYTADRTDRLLVELLDYLAISRPFHMVGYSMGGATAAVFAERHPEKLRSLTLIAPAGAGDKSFLVSLLTAPGLGDLIFHYVGDMMWHASAKVDSLSSNDPTAYMADYEAQARYEGYTQALLSSLQHYPLWDAGDAFSAIGASELPVQIVWGTEDEAVPHTNSEEIMTLIPQAELHLFDGVDHRIPQSEAGRLNTLLVDFVEANRIRRTSGGVGGKARGPEARLEPADCLCHEDADDAQL